MSHDKFIMSPDIQRKLVTMMEQNLHSQLNFSHPWVQSQMLGMDMVVLPELPPESAYIMRRSTASEVMHRAREFDHLMNVHCEFVAKSLEPVAQIVFTDMHRRYFPKPRRTLKGRSLDELLTGAGKALLLFLWR